MIKHMKGIKNQQLLVAIGALAISPFVLAQEQYSQEDNYDISSQYNVDNQNVENNIESEEQEFNPFMNLSSNLEQLELNRQERESELSLVESEIELQRKQFEKEMLPFQMEIERAQIQEQLYSIQDRMQQPTPPPSISMNDIENRIDAVAGEMLRKQKEEIAQLEKEKEEKNERENTFRLKLISENSQDGVFSIITDGENEDYRVSKGDYANNWEVIGIDKDRMRVVVRKGGVTEVVSPERMGNLSIISMSNNSSFSEKQEEGNMDNIPEPNFR